MSFTKIILIYFFVISTLSTQTLIGSQIDLGFHCFYLEITWKIHGILCHKRSGNPASVLTDFKIFILKICMKVPSIWHKKTWKNLEFRTKNLEKTWNLVFGKKWEPWYYTQQNKRKLTKLHIPFFIYTSCTLLALCLTASYLVFHQHLVNHIYLLKSYTNTITIHSCHVTDHVTGHVLGHMTGLCLLGGLIRLSPPVCPSMWYDMLVSTVKTTSNHPPPFMQCDSVWLV